MLDLVGERTTFHFDILSAVLELFCPKTTSWPY